MKYIARIKFRLIANLFLIVCVCVLFLLGFYAAPLIDEYHGSSFLNLHPMTAISCIYCCHNLITDCFQLYSLRFVVALLILISYCIFKLHR